MKTHKQMYQRIKVANDNRSLDEIKNLTSFCIQRMGKRKPRGEAGRMARKMALDAFRIINKIASEARSY